MLVSFGDGLHQDHKFRVIYGPKKAPILIYYIQRANLYVPSRIISHIALCSFGSNDRPHYAHPAIEQARKYSLYIHISIGEKEANRSVMVFLARSRGSRDNSSNLSYAIRIALIFFK
jgi:hypothetical protein